MRKDSAMKRFRIISLAVIALTASACKPPTEPKEQPEDDCDDFGHIICTIGPG